MKILAFDTSGAACSAALWKGDGICARRFERRERGHAERLMPMVAEVMAEGDTKLSEIDIFAATTGPGAFTGLRVGLATLRALALAAARPMLGLTSFEAIAHGTKPSERSGRCLVVAIESKRADFFVQTFSPALMPIGDAAAVLPERLAEHVMSKISTRPLLVAGDGARRAIPSLRATASDCLEASDAAFPDAAVVATLTATRSERASNASPSPFYLRSPDFTLSPGPSI